MRHHTSANVRSFGGHSPAIGARVLIDPSAVVIGDVALGKRLRSGFLYAGSPAREVRALSESELAYFCYSAANYVKLKDRYLAELEVA